MHSEFFKRFRPEPWPKPRDMISGDIEFIAECMRLWDRGCDTKKISTILFQPEYVVETAVWIGRERRNS